MMLGAHLSIRQGLLGALDSAEALGCGALQIFGYRRHEFYFDPKISAETRFKLKAEMDLWRDRLGRSEVKELAIHSRAVALLANEDKKRYVGAIKSFEDELRLAHLLRARYYVFHLGPYDGGSSRARGLDLAAGALAQALEDLPQSPMIVLENVPGGGRRMGSTLEELSRMASALRLFGGRFGFCLDAAHSWTSGYSLKTVDEAKRFWEQFESTIGSEKLALLHLNNSQLKLGCHLDRHAHLAEGHIPEDVYRYILKAWPAKAGILETPNDSPDANKENLAFLTRLLGDQ
ncbi:MAG: deoxyribonuclease IV [Elusimicrobia bacterium]|nr:deoxyribonuclease IV [Elusimicrobiota bacterium]